MKLVYNDSSHSYWLNGKRVKSASKVAQIAADSFTIEQWQKRQVAIGMTLDPTLAERVAVDLENREAIQTVCEEAANTAKANARAQRGTQRHRVFELLLLGKQDMFVTDQQRADAEVLARTLDAYDLKPIPDRVEQFVAWPDNGVVGRYDTYLWHEGRPVLVDLKGGENAVKYPHSTAVQLWLYRFAPHTSKTIVRNGDKSEVTEWTTAPDGADTDSAYVIYCDDHHEVGELWRIDLNAARAGGEMALGIVDWRKSYNYGKEMAQLVPLPKRPSSAESDHRETSGAEAAVIPSGGDGVSDSAEDWRVEAKRRYDLLNEHQKLDYTARKQSIDTSDRDAVFRLLDTVDPFNNTTPPMSESIRQTDIDPPLPPEEGGPVAADTIAALRRNFEALPAAEQLWISTLTVQGINAGHDWRTNVKPSVRRYELGRAVVRLAAAGADWGNDDVIRDLLRGVGADWNHSPVGDLLGRLDYLAATEFAAAVDTYLSTAA